MFCLGQIILSPLTKREHVCISLINCQLWTKNRVKEIHQQKKKNKSERKIFLINIYVYIYLYILWSSERRNVAWFYCLSQLTCSVAHRNRVSIMHMLLLVQKLGSENLPTGITSFTVSSFYFSRLKTIRKCSCRKLM